MINVCIFSHDQVTYDISANIDYSSFNRQIAIWADTDIRLIVNITAQSVSIILLLYLGNNGRKRCSRPTLIYIYF